jgi:hypothetical protein
MNETAPETRTPASLPLRPLPLDGLPPAVAKLLTGPAPAKLMAAKGIATLRPAELLVALYQLTFDADAAVKTAAERAPEALPDKVLNGPLAEPLPALVLHFFAAGLPANRTEPLEKLLYNTATADETFVALAGRLAERELEIILQNEARLLRCPAIVEALYFNKQTRMSSLNRAIELCARNNVRLDAVPAFDDVVKSLSETGAGTPADAEVVDELIKSEEVPAAEPDTRKGAAIDFSRLKLHDKVRLATLGNAHCRQVLLRDPNRIVAMAAVRSPNITESEIIAAAGSRNVNEDVIRYIANQRDFLKLYQVKLNLVNNPKCPLAFSLRFLTSLHAEDVKAVARSKNIPNALATAARKLVQTRGGGAG